MHGLKSGVVERISRPRVLVNSVAFTDDEAHVLSASSDGSVKVWDSKTPECKHTFKPPPPVYPNRDDDDDAYQTGTVPAVFSAVPHPKNDAHIIVTRNQRRRRRRRHAVETYWTNKTALPHTIVATAVSLAANGSTPRESNELFVSPETKTLETTSSTPRARPAAYHPQETSSPPLVLWRAQNLKP